jgi:hypothetical protein
MVFANFIKIFSSNAVESIMTKYLLFIIVFMLSFVLDISISRGETVKKIKTNDMDVYYKKTTVLKNWDKKGSGITKNENKLLLLDLGQKINPQQKIKKKEIKGLAVVQTSEAKVIRILVQGMIKLETPEASEKRSSVIEDSLLISSFKPLEIKEKLKIAKKENKTLIYGNDFERDCYLNKKDCGFSMHEEVKKYRNKLLPQKNA